VKTAFRTSFARDPKKINDRGILGGVRRVIEEIEAASDPSAVGDLKKLSGTTNFFRIRLGDYRIGIVIEAGVVEFVRCLPRRDLYRFFP
jgi:mRNA interferase RelE/StbE